MFVVIEMIERMKRDGKEGYMAFLDNEKGYDRVNRNILCEVLTKIGISEKIVNIIISPHFTFSCSLCATLELHICLLCLPFHTSLTGEMPIRKRGPTTYLQR